CAGRTAGLFDAMAARQAEAVFGSAVVRHADGSEEVRVRGLQDRLVGLAEEDGVGVGRNWPGGKVVEERFDALVVPVLAVPTFVRDDPEDTTPLTRPHRDTAGLTEKVGFVRWRGGAGDRLLRAGGPGYPAATPGAAVATGC